MVFFSSKGILVLNVYRMDTYTARIYRVVCDLDDEEYVGSTKMVLSRRMCHHRAAAQKKPTSGKLYPRMIEHGAEHFKIYLIEELQVRNKEELRKREQEIIEERRAAMNCHRAWIDEEGIKARQKEYLAANKERTYEVQKAYNEAHQEERAAYNKAYSLANRAAISERVRLRNAVTGTQKEYLKKKRAEDKAAGKYKCELCNTTYVTKGSLDWHLKTPKHAARQDQI